MKNLMILCFILKSYLALSRFAKLDEAAWQTKTHSEVTVFKDGTNLTSTKFFHKILKENGKSLGTLSFNYNPSAESFEIIKGQTKKSSSDLIKLLHPTPAIAGTPKNKTIVCFNFAIPLNYFPVSYLLIVIT